MGTHGEHGGRVAQRTAASVAAVVGIAVLVAVAVAAPARADDAAALDVLAVDVAERPRVEAVVATPQGMGAEGAREEVRVVEDGRPRPATVRPLAGEGLAVLVVVDTALPPDVLDAARAATAALVEALPEDVLAVVVAGGGGAPLVVDGAAGGDDVVDDLAAIEPGPSQVRDGLTRGLAALAEGSDVRRVAVVVSSAEPDRSVSRPAWVAAGVEAAGAVVRPIVLGDGPSAAPLLADLATASGGATVAVGDEEAVAAAVEDVAADLAGQRVVSWVTPAGGTVDVAITLARGDATARAETTVVLSRGVDPDAVAAAPPPAPDVDPGGARGRLLAAGTALLLLALVTALLLQRSRPVAAPAPLHTTAVAPGDAADGSRMETRAGTTRESPGDVAASSLLAASALGTPAAPATPATPATPAAPVAPSAPATPSGSTEATSAGETVDAPRGRSAAFPTIPLAASPRLRARVSPPDDDAATADVPVVPPAPSDASPRAPRPRRRAAHRTAGVPLPPPPGAPGDRAPAPGDANSADDADDADDATALDAGTSAAAVPAAPRLRRRDGRRARRRPPPLATTLPTPPTVGATAPPHTPDPVDPAPAGDRTAPQVMSAAAEESAAGPAAAARRPTPAPRAGAGATAAPPPPPPDLGEVLRRVTIRLRAGDDLAGALGAVAAGLPRRQASRVRRAAGAAEAGADPTAVLAGLAGRRDRHERAWLVEVLAGDAPLPVVTALAARVVGERGRVRRERGWFGLEAGVAAVGLSLLPVAAAVVREVVAPGWLAATVATGAGAALLAVAGLLSFVAAAWLLRLARPPYSPWPRRWRVQRALEAREEALLDALDRAAIATVSGADLGAAVGGVRAAGGAQDPAVARALDQVRDRLSDAPDPTAALLDQATRLRAQRLRRGAAQAARVPLHALVPFACCVVPATVIVVAVPLG